MKPSIALAQISSHKGDLSSNIQKHIFYIKEAANRGAEIIVFPELSLLGYHPSLAADKALSLSDSKLSIFDQLAKELKISILLGFPLKTDQLPAIAMGIFTPEEAPAAYCKTMLHQDEEAFFTPGKNQVVLHHENSVIAPAICYESMQKGHLTNALSLGANLYLASVAKEEKGMDLALSYFSTTAKTHKLAIYCCNAVGNCEGFENAGKSAIWNDEGKMVSQLGNEEGLIIH